MKRHIILLEIRDVNTNYCFGRWKNVPSVDEGVWVIFYLFEKNMKFYISHKEEMGYREQHRKKSSIGGLIYFYIF